jgi:hypothetical protein
MPAKPFENPLTPNQLLRDMHVAMLEARALGRRLRTSRLEPGLEALWAAPAIGLRGHAEDLVAAPGAGPALDLILGAKLKSLKRNTPADTRRLATGHPNRLVHALGAAMALKALKQKGILLAFARASELTARQWKPLLATCVSAELPIVFVILPEPSPRVDILKLAASAKLPAIPVDAADPIAIYRVAQESIGRARAAGGAAMIVGISFGPKAADPIALLAGQLQSRKIATRRSLEAAEAKTRAVVAALHLA